MNWKLIFFSSLITAIIGVMLGLGIGIVFRPKYSSQIYQDIPRKYAVVGGVAGLIIGGCQESIRQLKKQRDEEEAQGGRRDFSVSAHSKAEGQGDRGE